jgi:hypothetical protein
MKLSIILDKIILLTLKSIMTTYNKIYKRFQNIEVFKHSFLEKINMILTKLLRL